ncbi:MAG: OadG family protein [Clostridia bacterium]|nr:OadG family protein [Clostridia bacterium]
MQENLIVGTKIMGAGMGIVFLVLAILYVIIKFMGKMANK